MTRDLLIVGAGGHGREVLDVVEAANAASGRAPWRVLGFVDDGRLDGEQRARLERRGIRLLGTVDDLGVDGAIDRGPSAAAVVAVGDPAVRERLTGRVREHGVDLAPALVHPSSTVGGDVLLGDGVVVAAGAQLTTNIRVGTGVQVNVGCSISHDVVLGDHVTLSPGCRLTGAVRVDRCAFFGTGAIVAPGVRIGERARVGAGSVVLHDVAPGDTVWGAPARARGPVLDEAR